MQRTASHPQAVSPAARHLRRRAASHRVNDAQWHWHASGGLLQRIAPAPRNKPAQAGACHDTNQYPDLGFAFVPRKHHPAADTDHEACQPTVTRIHAPVQIIHRFLQLFRARNGLLNQYRTAFKATRAHGGILGITYWTSHWRWKLKWFIMQRKPSFSCCKESFTI